MTALFGPQNANVALVLPTGTLNQRYGTQQTWVKDCSAPGRNDGTVLDAAFYNRLIGNLEYLVSMSGVTATSGDMTAIYRAMVATVSYGTPAGLNTLAQLAASINNDPQFNVTMQTALNARVRYDIPQGLTTAQQQQVATNLGYKAVVFSGSYNDLSNTPTLGTAASQDYGTAANQLVRLDSSAKLPAVDGSQLTGITATGAVGYASAQSLTDAQRLQGLANLGIPFQCGRLLYSSATALTYLPFKGDLIKINGAVYRIPTTGIAGLANTGVYVNGVAGQNLAASTRYYVYAFVNAGVLTAEFSTTAHSASATALNVGTEIKTGYDNYSLIGMVYTNGSSQFVDTTSFCGVISWFNRRNRVLQLANYSAGPVGFAYQTEFNSGWRLSFLCWGDEGIATAAAVANVSVTAIANVGFSIGLDSAAPNNSTIIPFMNNSNNNCVSAVAAASSLSEGLHYMTLLGGTNNTGASVTYTGMGMTLSIRG